MNDLINSLKYIFYIYSHPSDGFWFMKSQKKANIKTGLALLVMLILTTIIRVYTTGYLMSNITIADFSIWILILIIIGAVILYCISNWALTTLIDGKGTFVEIFISLMYSLTPITIVNIPIAIISNLVVLSEIPFLEFINIIAIVWSLFLILAANHSVHDFSVSKSIVTFIGTLLVMLIISVIGILFLNLCQQVLVWVSSIVREVTYRL